MIKLEHISKTFGDTGDGVHAVKDVSLEIGDGEIFGIIGFSGAGKSTLVRCINLLERPTSGSITVNGQKLTWMEQQADGKSCRVIVPDDQLSLPRQLQCQSFPAGADQFIRVHKSSIAPSSSP